MTKTGSVIPNSDRDWPASSMSYPDPDMFCTCKQSQMFLFAHIAILREHLAITQNETSCRRTQRERERKEKATGLFGVQKLKFCPLEKIKNTLMSISYSVFLGTNLVLTLSVIRVSSTWKLCVFIKG